MRLDADLLKAKTLQLAGEAGLKVEHEELSAIMLEGGCCEAPTGRIRIPECLPMPENFAGKRNGPTVHRVRDPQDVARPRLRLDP